MKLLKDHIILLDRIGVYEIFCLKTGKNYVGSTSVSFKKRLEEHNKHLKNNKHVNIHLQRAYNKYKDKNFEMRILEVCSKEEIIEREQFWIDTFQATKYGYNICPIATSRLGVIASKETREKIKNTTKNRDFSNRKKREKFTRKERKIPPINEIIEIKNLYDTGEWSTYRLAKKFGLSTGKVYHIVNNGSYQYLDENGKKINNYSLINEKRRKN